MHATYRAELGLNDSRQVVRNLILIEVLRGEAEVHRRKLIVGRLQIDDRSFGLRGQVIADLRHLRLNLCERGIRVIVQLEVNRDRAQSLSAGRRAPGEW